MGYVQVLTVSLLSAYFVCQSISGAQQQQAPIVRDVKIKFVVPSLPSHHYQFWLKNHPRVFEEFKTICSQVPRPLDLTNSNYFRTLHANLTFEDTRYFKDFDHGKKILNEICTKIDLVSKSCWGYESSCQIIHLMPECHGLDQTSSPKEEQDQKIAWFSQADFGYILDLRREMSRYCMPDKYSNDTWKSSLECTKYFRTCRGENLMMHLKDSTKVMGSSPGEIFKSGDIGGWNCDLQTKRIPEEKGQQERMQSWFTELQNYSLITDTDPKACDLVIDKQAYIIKLDSPSNMYRYFSTFLNLYATIHLNNKFSEDNQIIVWDDLPRSKFDQMWVAFTRNPLLSIKQFQDKRLCLKKFITVIPPKAVGGLYQGTKLVKGCSKSGLFDAFNKHVLHRLGISQRFGKEFDRQKFNQTLRVTIVSRSRPHRKVLNQQELMDAVIAKSNDYQVDLVDLAEKSLREQLDIAQNTDLLIGVNGAALTNLLFLPDWAALLELNDCGENTYGDLARLRGVKYFAPRDKPKFSTKLQVDDEHEKIKLTRSKLLNHDKFSNYRIDVGAFLSLFEEAAETVKRNRLQYFDALSNKQLEGNRKADEPVQDKGSNSHQEL